MIRLSGAILVLALAAGQTPSQPPVPSGGEQVQAPQGESDPGQDSQPNTDVQGITVVINNQEQADAPGNRTDSENQTASNNWWDAPTAVAVATGTIAIAAFTFFLMVFTVVQVCIAWRNHRHFVIAERAYVGLDTLDIEPGPVAGDGERIIVVGFKNSGHTRARVLSANVSVRGAVFNTTGHSTTIVDLDALPDEPEYDDGTFVPPTILDAGETTRWRHRVTDFTGPAWNLGAMTPGSNGRLWIYGKVTYANVFQPSRIHTTKWAREYDPMLSQQFNQFKFSHLPKPKYNDAD